MIDPVDKQKYEYLQLPHQDHWGLLLREDHPLATKSAISASDLAKVPLLVSRQTQVNQQLTDWLGQSISAHQIVGTYNLLYNASLLVQSGAGCALCLAGIVNTKGTPLTFIPLSPAFTARVNLIWKKHQTFSQAAQVFLSKVQETFSSKKN